MTNAAHSSSERPDDRDDELVTDRVMNELMGKDASLRFKFIMERAGEADALDV